MRLRDTPAGYGPVSILLHWTIVLAVFGLFGLGLWMTGLTYYDPWYNDAPWLHRSLGVLLIGVVVLRTGWRVVMRRPALLPSLARWEQRAARAMHGLLLTLLVLVLFTGYLVPSADGRPVEVFGWFQAPALVLPMDRQADRAGQLHLWLSWMLVVLAGLHGGAALKHHFIDRDTTLRRMLWPAAAPNTPNEENP